MMCKRNYAAHVKQNVPHDTRVGPPLGSILGIFGQVPHELLLDNNAECGIIKLPYSRCLQAGLGDRQRRKQTIKERPFARRRRAQFTSRTSCGPQVSPKRVLRPARSGSSQVRDAASRLGRKGLGHGCREGVRHLAANFLSSQGKPRRSGHSRVGSEKAWTARSAQTPRRCDWLSQATRASGPAHSSSSACSIRSRPFRRGGPSKDNRTGPSGKKNGPLSSRQAIGALFDSTTIFERYERVRRIGAGEVAEPQYRDALALLLRQGMLRWAGAVDGCRPNKPHRPTAADTLSVAAQRTIVIHLLAQVVMATPKGRIQ